MYQLNERVSFRYRNFNLATDEFLGYVTEPATVTRVWDNERYVTVVTDSGKTFTRVLESASIRKV
jgi:hypothetical protein